MITEGQRVAFCGDADGHTIGEEGLVISASGSAVHVKWDRGDITLLRADEMVALGQRHLSVASEVDDSMEGLSPAVAVRRIYAEQGEAGVLHALISGGYLANKGYAGEALATVGHMIRRDPEIRSALAHLGPEEGVTLVESAALAVLQEAFRDA